jgi:enterochelin esterase-like enzyme
MTTELLPLVIPFESSIFDVQTLKVTSKALKNNPLGDSITRMNYLLVPKSKGPHPVIFHLSGYFGTGYQSFNFKTLEESFPELINRQTQAKTLPLAVHVFVDAVTAFGGSQFINSKGCGQYSDYIQSDLMEAVEKHLPIKKDKQFRVVMGSSSGGYGALHHVSVKESEFGVALAIAPDSCFEISLLPDLYKNSEALRQIPTVAALRKKLLDPKFKEGRSFFSTMNAVAMSLCYGESKEKLEYPVDLQTGALKEKQFSLWKKKDPVQFMEERASFLKKSNIYLSVGRYDEYSLYFGARQIKQTLEKNKISHTYLEFDGGHYKSIHQKVEALQWLKKLWI